jgi:FkbM family methyltransferase
MDATAAIPIDNPLFGLLQPRRRTAIVDIGANPIDGDAPYLPMLQRGLCTVTGFEPQAAALASLNARKSSLENYLPYAVGDGSVRTLHFCAADGMTSLLAPDPRKLALFHLFPDFGRVTGSTSVQTRRLDDIGEIENLDFLKIDIQGTELDVFRGGRRKLAAAVAVQTEVSFITLYEGQPGLGEIDVELRAQGFVPHAMPALKRWTVAPLLVGNDPRRPLNQLLEADLVYVRDFAHTERMDDEQLKHLALITHCCYGSFDLALHCVLAVERRGGLTPGTAQRYLQLATGT